MQRRSERKNLIQAVERALNILEVVRDCPTSVRAVDIARQVKLSPAASNNIVRTLYIRGYLDQDEKGCYLLGGESYLLGTGAYAWARLRSHAREPMAELSRKNGNLSFLGVVSRGQMIAIEIVEAQGPVVIPSQQGWLNQLHCTATGKVLLAAMPELDYADFKPHYPLLKLAEKTITDWDVLEHQLNGIRQHGYAVCCDESVFGVTSIAVPLRNAAGEVIAGLSTVFSSYFLNPAYQTEMVAQLQETAAQIAKLLQTS